MNCEHCQAELEDFLYGELRAPRAAAVKAHLAACDACRRVRESLEREAEVFARYYEQAALEPSEEMWEAIRERIHNESLEAQRARDWLNRLGERWALSPLGRLLEPVVLRQVVLAAVLVVVSVTATTLYFSFRKDDVAKVDPTPTPQPTLPQPSPTVAPSATPVAPSPKDQSPSIADSKRPQNITPVPKGPKVQPPASEDELIVQQLARAEREYQSAIQLLDRRIARHKENLDPELVAQYERSLALIDNSIAASRRALREHPKDPIAAQFLLAAYNKKVELMQEIAMR
jgi:hypothetical protein